MVGFLAGVALGIGGHGRGQKAADQHLAQPKEPQARAIPALTSPLLRQGEPVWSDPSAPLTIVECSDFECGYFRRFNKNR